MLTRFGFGLLNLDSVIGVRDGADSPNQNDHEFVDVVFDTGNILSFRGPSAEVIRKMVADQKPYRKPLFGAEAPPESP